VACAGHVASILAAGQGVAQSLWTPNLSATRGRLPSMAGNLLYYGDNLDVLRWHVGDTPVTSTGPLPSLGSFVLVRVAYGARRACPRSAGRWSIREAP
jgi:hypothetical protein